MHLRLKVSRASSVVLAGSLWLLTMIGIALLRSEGIALAYIIISWIVMLVLVIQELGIRKQGKEVKEAESTDPEVTFGKVVLLLFIIFLWLMAMLGLLAILPFQGMIFMFGIWAIWIGILVFIVRYLEIKWRIDRTNQMDEAQSGED